ncbi:MAG: ABC transporter permease subunit [Acidobacteriota bacterium]|nr:ABC transporter permease subunit [Acidobacteriota bacterium]
MAAASRSIRRLRRIDRAAVFVIGLGGIGVVAAVLGILVFVVSEALPLFRSARITPVGRARLEAPAEPRGARTMRATGIDEYRRYLYVVEPAGLIALHRADSGQRARQFPLPGLAGAGVASSSRSVSGHYVAAGLTDGRASLVQMFFVPQYEAQALIDLTVEARERGVVTLDAAGRAIRQISYIEQDTQRFVAGIVADEEVAYVWTDADGAEHQASLRVASGERITQVRIGRNGSLLAGTDRGHVYHWELGTEPVLTDVSPVSPSAITAMEWMLGGHSFMAAAADGSLTGWLRAPAGDGAAMVRAHTFAPQASPVIDMALSARERSFATLGADGAIVLRHQTSERVLAALTPDQPALTVLIAPKSDALLTLDAGVLQHYALDNPHPETSWRTLFGKVWYEGYAEPQYVWQSTGATDDIEPKFSLVPLVFGTIKGTFYAVLFAVPLAVLAALYTSQFTHASLRSTIKPTVEIMAALPSVVIGFLAGLYLASAVERHLVGVLLMIPLLPLAGMSGVLLWRLLPRRLAARVRPGSELLVILPLLVLAGWLALLLGPVAEGTLLSGDARLWLKEHWGLTYDQRNCLVVGIAMGFAVIPIIFTISEDAFSSVPSSLTAASLALGASRWQTAVHIVLPTANPGVFSAIMVGFGRAVGETMIVLMATGNTPLMDWSLFNGMRTLSANIAVEIPEAPHGGTLYRVLFLAAAILFLMTFLVNTAAELIRQRLRERYRAI